MDLQYFHGIFLSFLAAKRNGASRERPRVGGRLVGQVPCSGVCIAHNSVLFLAALAPLNAINSWGGVGGVRGTRVGYTDSRRLIG